ncbi:hypothetical protein [Massilioclostridium coli]|uniref:hypothetical protein n=1 Tax=Massilioclostridium coli TaxID=1870991 RepID=UPI00085C0A6D|nr:hypothetical protein [Massilioclostridium coli]
MKSSKKKVITTGLAITLAATLLIGGGTFAYLQGTTNDVVNNFHTNKVLVDLEETTGNDYEIIPGTTQEKDPKVTVNATVPSYVYVEVKLANEVADLVDYEIVDGWLPLEKYTTQFTKVYYREIEASDSPQEFYVLKDNKVSYDAALENSDMMWTTGKLKTGETITFKASAIQKAPFYNPEDAYRVEMPNSEESFESAIENGAHNLIVQDNIDFATVTKMSNKGNVTVDLNGKVLGNSKNTSNWGVFQVGTNTTLTLDGEGTVSGVSNDADGYHMAVSTTNQFAKLIINNGTYTNEQVNGNDAQYDLIYCETGTIEINGGTFICKTPKWTLNCKDANYKDGIANIIVKGGKFFEFDPSNCTVEGENTNFVAEGYHVDKSTDTKGTWYTVVAD